MASYYDNQSLLSGFRYSDPQFRADTTGIARGGQLVAEALKSGRQREMENAKFAAEMEANKRTKELFDRQTTEYNRQQSALETSKEIAREMLASPWSEKFGGAEGTAKMDALLNKEAERRMAAGESPFSAEEAAGIQKTYEANRPYKEDAKRYIVGRMIDAGATAGQANAEAEGLTAGLISRADEQAALDARRKALQDMYDNQAKANLEMLKANIDISKANQGADVDKAKLQQDLYKAMYGTGGGSSGGGKEGSQSGAGGISETLQKVGWYDASKAEPIVKKYHDAGYSYEQIHRAMKNAVDTDPTAWVLADNKINYDAVSDTLAKQLPGAGSITDAGKVGGSIRDVAAGITAQDLMAKVAPYERAGYNPDRMVELLKVNAPTVFVKQPEQVGTSGVSTAGGKEGGKVFQLSTGGQLIRDTSIPLTEQLNNPGALKQADRNNSSIKWQGEVGRDDQGHIIFDTPENGARAQIINMQSQIKKGTTLQDMIKTYATGNQDSYINRVSKETGIKPTEVLDKEDALGLVKAMSKVEAGSKSTGKYSDEIYDRASKLVPSKLSAPPLDALASASKEDRLANLVANKKIADTMDWSTGEVGDTGSKEMIAKDILASKEPDSILPSSVNKKYSDSSVRKAIADATEFYKQNGAGALDYATAVKGIKDTTGMSRTEAMDLYNSIVNNPDNRPRETASLLDRLDRHYSNEADIQMARNLAIANKVKQGLPLTEGEKQWILDMSKTYKNNQVLKELGIK